jgi:poly-gamma-glutamate capsule biosynthesis protein CapA/YwtB (metallophosphatase superfamily)
MKMDTRWIALLIALMIGPQPLVADVPNDSNSFTLVLGGDVMVGRYMGKRLREHGGGDPFVDIAPLLQRGDLTVVNLESPVSDADPRVVTRAKNPPRYSVRFRVPTRYASMMKRYGVDVAVLANNHAEDCRTPGIADTTAALDAAGIAHVGASVTKDPFAPRVLSVNGHTVVVLAVSLFRNMGKPRPGVHLPVAHKPYSETKIWMPRRISELRKEHPTALIVASVHWGGEWKDRPSVGQVRLGRWLIDAGANVVMGHHTHVLQPVEAYKDGLILYCLGNLVFDIIRADGRRSAVFETVFDRTPAGGWRAQKMVIHPIQLRQLKAGPRPSTTREADGVFKPIQTISGKRFSTPLRRVKDTLVWERSTR